MSKSEHVPGAILADQVENLDLKERQAEFIERAEDEVLEETLMKISALIGAVAS